jgi:hypothetical protein
MSLREITWKNERLIPPIQTWNNVEARSIRLDRNKNPKVCQVCPTGGVDLEDERKHEWSVIFGKEEDSTAFVLAQVEGRLYIFGSLTCNLSQQVNDQFPIFCIVIVVVGESPAVRLYETQ